MPQNADWDLIFSIAAKAGVNYFAYHQWKRRGTVPHRWRNVVVAESGGKITWDNLLAMDKGRK